MLRGLTPIRWWWWTTGRGRRCPGAIRRETAGGPGVARNEGLEHVDTELVAFLDSDADPPPDWIERLAGHFEDPTVAAVAPRITGKLLDMGEHPAEVRPGTPVPYVPTAAVLMRRSALPHDPFDPALRYGEDVDLIWRLIDQGWRVRYDPSVVVEHEDHHVLKRRFLYGTSAAPLKQRHPDKLKHVIVRPWPAATLALLAARRPTPRRRGLRAPDRAAGPAAAPTRRPVHLAPVWTAKTLAPHRHAVRQARGPVRGGGSLRTHLL